MDREEHPHAWASSAPSPGAAGAPAVDSELARRVWGRYGGSPGVVSLPAVPGSVRRIARFASHHLPLLAQVQRRWAPAGAGFPPGWPVLPYTGPSVATGTLFPPAIEAERHAAATEASVRGGMQRTPRFSGDFPAEAGPPATFTTRVTDLGATIVQRDRVASAEGARPLSPTRAREPVAKAGAARPVAVRTGDLGMAILQRHLGGPAARAAQSDAAMPAPAQPEARSPAGAPLAAISPALPEGWVPPLRPVAGEAPPPRGEQAAPGDAPGSGDWGQAIWHRYLRGPATRAVQRWATASERALSDVSNMSTSQPQPLLLLSRAVRTEPGTSRALPGAEMPLASVTEWAGDTGPAPAPAVRHGTATVVPLQRAAADASSAAPPSMPPRPVGAPYPPTAPVPGPASLDVERLADEVYAIIERRLTIERESLGL